MPPGMKCPNCAQQSFHLNLSQSFRECINCHFVGWSIVDTVNRPGRGQGIRCPHCEKQTLHRLEARVEGSVVLRCSRCLYGGVVQHSVS